GGDGGVVGHVDSPGRIDGEILPPAVSARQGSPTGPLRKAIGPRKDRGAAASGLPNRSFTRTAVPAAAVPDGRGRGPAAPGRTREHGSGAARPVSASCPPPGGPRPPLGVGGFGGPRGAAGVHGQHPGG